MKTPESQQSRKKKPTRRQISTWEYDGGIPAVHEKDAVLINGTLCITFSEKLKAYARTPWDLLRNRLSQARSKKTHH